MHSCKRSPSSFLTALADEVNEAEALSLGAVDYILKPFVPTLIRLRVKNHLEMKQQRDLLHRLALTDGLCAIPNRRAFDACLDREWRRAMRGRTAVSLILIDIDHFKAYNDQYGHLAGDDCLRQVAQALAATAQHAGDCLARFGGEEFVCLLPGSEAAMALALAEALRAGVKALHLEHRASPIAPWVTVSLGVATAYPRPGEALATLIATADEHLYQAKARGRNQVVCGAEP